MNSILSACGLLCNQCEYFGEDCRGCHSGLGSPFCAKDMMPDKMCPLYKCAVIEKNYHHCGDCAELPCKKFTDLKDPGISAEQHNQSVQERVLRLR